MQGGSHGDPHERHHQQEDLSKTHATSDAAELSTNNGSKCAPRTKLDRVKLFSGSNTFHTLTLSDHTSMVSGQPNSALVSRPAACTKSNKITPNRKTWVCSLGCRDAVLSVMLWKTPNTEYLILCKIESASLGSFKARQSMVAGRAATLGVGCRVARTAPEFTKKYFFRKTLRKTKDRDVFWKRVEERLVPPSAPYMYSRTVWPLLHCKQPSWFRGCLACYFCTGGVLGGAMRHPRATCNMVRTFESPPRESRVGTAVWPPYTGDSRGSHKEILPRVRPAVFLGEALTVKVCTKVHCRHCTKSTVLQFVVYKSRLKRRWD